jgi:hypothetical protein
LEASGCQAFAGETAPLGREMSEGYGVPSMMSREFACCSDDHTFHLNQRWE